MTVFLGIVFFVPELDGWFLEKDNFAPADILQTPPEIVPLWYLTPYYSILRAVTFEWLPGGAKLWGCDRHGRGNSDVLLPAVVGSGQGTLDPLPRLDV